MYLWFKQRRAEGAPISGPMLSEKAMQFHQKMYGEESHFSGSTGWQWRFCKRHGIKILSLQGKKLFADLKQITIQVFPKCSNVMKLALTFNSLQKHLLLLLRGQLMAARRAKEAGNMERRRNGRKEMKERKKEREEENEQEENEEEEN